MEVDAPFHDDPAPPLPVGVCPGLWDYEVVELMLLGSDERYLEVGSRRTVTTWFSCSRAGARWCGKVFRSTLRACVEGSRAPCAGWRR